MWFKRKQKNRRLGRESVLDVKLRSDQLRKARVRVAAMTIGICFGTLAVLFIVWRTGQFALNKLVFQNDAFAVREVDVQTDGVIRVEQLRRWAAVKPGDNLLALDLARVKRDLELSSAIRSVAVERVLPGTLRIRVAEREPLVWVAASRRQPGGGSMGVAFQLDDSGHVMTPLDRSQLAAPPGPGDAPLPLLVGMSDADLRPGRRVDAPQVLAALQLVREFEHSPMAGLVELKRIDVSAADVIRVYTGPECEVTFGIKQIEAQMRRWRAIYDYGQRLNKAIAALDLSVSDNVPASWIDGSRVPAAPSKAKQPTRSRKKNA
ncbi:MAG: FtsQ-type POTRA domain-containing protein [Verrucomicrobia bacterium]|nr:FtsQ-type POTRA domain-containing protein [Verrucomicrobiota bacterium]